jgi:hypothetical protein
MFIITHTHIGTSLIQLDQISVFFLSAMVTLTTKQKDAVTERMWEKERRKESGRNAGFRTVKDIHMDLLKS